MVGSAFMLVGIIATAFLAKGRSATLTFDLVELAKQRRLRRIDRALAVLRASPIAFAVKVPIFPLHTWLPDAHTQAPTGGSVILAGVMLKLGTYGLLRFGVYLFPEAARWSRSLLADARGDRHHLRRDRGDDAEGPQAAGRLLVGRPPRVHRARHVRHHDASRSRGGVMQNINHGVSTGALFLLVGMIYERRHTRQISELKGLQKVAPIFAGVFMVVMLSSIGVPGLNGFVGEYLVLIGSFLTARWWAVVAATGVILAALYLLWAYQRVFHGEPDEANKSFAELQAGRRPR